MTNKQLYDELTGLRADLKDQFDAKAETTVTDDHETRIRSLERFRFAFPSLSLTAAVAAASETLYLIFHR